MRNTYDQILRPIWKNETPMISKSSLNFTMKCLAGKKRLESHFVEHLPPVLHWIFLVDATNEHIHNHP